MAKCLFYDNLQGKLIKASIEDIKRAENVGYALAMSKLEIRKMLSDDEVSAVIDGIYKELSIDPPENPLWYDDFKDALPYSVLQIFALLSELKDKQYLQLL